MYFISVRERVRAGGDGGAYGERTRHDVRRVDKLAVVAGVWAETLDIAPAMRALAAGRAWGGAGLSYSSHGPIVHGFIVAADERRRAGCRPTRRAVFWRGRPLQLGIVNANSFIQSCHRCGIGRKPTSSIRRPRDTIHGSR